jgi:AraC-like DNA-binding protein
VKIASIHHLRVPNFSVHALCGVLKDAGLDWRTALANAEIDPDAVDRLGGTLPATKELAFQLQFVALTKDRIDLWVQAARAYTMASFGVRGFAFLTAPTMEAWVELVDGATDVGFALQDLSALRTPDGTVTGIEFTYPGVPEEMIPFSVYRDLVWNTQTLPWVYGGRFPFTQVDFPLPEISLEVSASLSCDVNCGSEKLRIWWDPAASTRELPFGDAFQHETWLRTDTQILATLRTTGDWTDTVARTIKAAPNLNRNLANVAAALRVSPRTLQRKLELAGSNFARLRDETLSDLASDLLSNTDHSVSRISRKLGYADPASFTIAFKRWKGVPPIAYRDAARYTNDTTSEE